MAQDSDTAKQMDKPLRELIELIQFTEGVSAKIHGVLDEAAIYSTVTREFARTKRYTASIALLTDDGASLRIAETSLSRRRVKAVEKATGDRLDSIDLSRSSTLSRVVRAGETLQVDADDVLSELFPPPLASSLAKAVGYESRPIIITPLERHGEIIGLFSLYSGDLAECLVPSVKNLAHHISLALETADEHAKRRETEQALKESEDKFRTVAEQSPNMIFINRKGRVVYANRRCEEIMGYTRDEFYSPDFDFLILIAPEYQDVVSAAFRRQMKGEEFESLEYALVTKERQRLEAVLTTRLIDYDGEKAILGTVNDITERKRAEEALRESEEKYRTLVDQSLQGLLIAQAPPLRLAFANPAVAEIWGFAPDELISLSPQDLANLIHPEDRALVLGRFRDRLEGKPVPPYYEFRTFGKDGTVHWVEMSANRIDYQGQPAVQVALVDITERKQAEQALRESEERLKLALEAANDGLFDWNMQTGEAYFSPRYYTMLGYEPYELPASYDTWMGLIHPDDREYAINMVNEYTEGKRERHEMEYRQKAKSGEWLWVLSRGKAIERDANGTAVRMAGTHVDITERKRAEEAVRESERRFRSLFETMTEGVVFYDVICDDEGTPIDSVIVDANPAYQVHTGIAPEEAIGRKVSDLYGPEVPPYLHIYERAASTGAPTSLELYFAPMRKYFCISVCSPVEGQFATVFEDITERKQAEEERERLLTQVQEQAQRVQQIVDTVPEGVLLLDTDGRVILANPLGQGDLATLASAKVGDTLTHLGGRPLAELLTSPPKGLWHELTTDNRHFQAIARPFETGARPGGWVLVIRDVTHQREAEQRTQQQERLAAVGQLAAGIAHDFNNIMAVITLYSGMSLHAPDLPPKVHERLETINQQARQASELIQQIMDFSRRAVLERGPMDLLSFLKEQVKLLSRTLPESIRIDMTYGKDEYTVNADPTRVQQAIMNLATNARDAMPKGGTLRIGLERMRVIDRDTAPLPEIEVGDWVRMTVSDSGTGIPPDVLPRVFDPFFTTKPPGEGTGLGLSQVYGIIKQHEGHVDIQTEAGEGTTFIIYLPALSVRQPEATDAEVQPPIQGRGQTILVVEDDAATRGALVDSLEPLGYHVLEAAHGQQALTVFEQHADQIALVLSDIVMPKMGGEALFRAVRKRVPSMKVLLLTGHPLEEEELEALRAEGLTGWLPKPPSLHQLAQAVAEALQEEEE